MEWIADTDDQVLEELGRRIRIHRLEKNWTQEELARRAGVNRTTLGDLERGASAHLSTFIAVLRALGGLGSLATVLTAPWPRPVPSDRPATTARQRATGRRGTPKRPAQDSTSRPEEENTPWPV